MPPISAPLTTTRSKRVLREAPEPRRRAHDERVDQLVEVPLVLEQRRERARSARAIAGASAGRSDPDVVGERDAAEADDARRGSARARARRSEALPTSVESANVGARKWSSQNVAFGIATMPPTIASSASIAHRRAHRQRRARRSRARGRGSRRRCPRPRRWRGWSAASGWKRWPCSISSRASGARLAEEGAEDHPERVERGQQRADVARDLQRPVPAAAAGDEQQDRVLREVAAERRHARQREPADDEAAEGERQRAAQARHPVERLARRPSPPITEPAAMNSSALKKACVIRWNRPAV